MGNAIRDLETGSEDLVLLNNFGPRTVELVDVERSGEAQAVRDVVSRIVRVQPFQYPESFLGE